MRLCGATTFTLDALLANGEHQNQSVVVSVHGSCPAEEQRADLKARSLTADHTTAGVGQTIEFTAKIKNQGNKDASLYSCNRGR